MIFPWSWWNSPNISELQQLRSRNQIAVLRDEKPLSLEKTLEETMTVASWRLDMLDQREAWWWQLTGKPGLAWCENINVIDWCWKSCEHLWIEDFHGRFIAGLDFQEGNWWVGFCWFGSPYARDYHYVVFKTLTHTASWLPETRNYIPSHKPCKDHPLVIKAGNGKSPVNGSLNRKIIWLYMRDCPGLSIATFDYRSVHSTWES